MASRCHLCDDKQQHPFFVSLFGTPPDSSIRLGHSVSSRISVGRNPFKRVLEYNGHFDQKDQHRKRKRGAPNWILICSVGPFTNGKSSKFHDDWRRLARKVSCRLVWAILHCEDVQYGEGLRLYLNRDYHDILLDQLQRTPAGRTFLARFSPKIEP
jgi:hypothetical protein